MLKVSELAVAYAGIQAVHAVDLAIEEGEAVALLGANGAGKSSTLRAIVGSVPHEGAIEFDGCALKRTRPDRLASAGLLMVPEGRHVFGSMSVHDNLLVGQSARRGRAGLSIDEIYDIFTPLQRLRGRAGWSLSGGEQQMVAVGRALAGAPRLLLLDEPSMGLAPVVVREMYEALHVIKTSTTLLVVEQNAYAALSLCDRGYVMTDGRIVSNKSARELAEDPQLIGEYLGQGDVMETVQDGSIDPVSP